MGMGREEFRRRGRSLGREHEVEADGHPERLLIIVLANTVIQPGRKDHQKTGFRVHNPEPLIVRVMIANGPTMTYSKPWNQLIELMPCVQTEGSILPLTITTEIHDGTHMGIGMVMPTHHLPSRAEHRPTALEVQGNLVKIKSCALQIHPNACHHLVR